jgi:hypothetical protein
MAEILSSMAAADTALHMNSHPAAVPQYDKNQAMS